VKRFHAAIFDMDGLLLDTERIALLAFLEACEHFGIGAQPEVFTRCLGTNEALGMAILEAGLEGRVDHLAFRRVWESRYVESITSRPVPLKDGAGELLEHLASLSMPLAVATSSNTPRARQKLRDAGILDRFAAVVGGDQVPRSKPDPDIYLKAAASLGVAPAMCLALEDSENGVRAALSSGMTVIQIPDLVEPAPHVREFGHIILRSLREVADYAFA
jgi:HAD superfamily hydrolase (TIGR01509 family)